MREVKPTIFRRIRSLSPLMKSALIIGLCTLLTLGGFLVYTLTEESRRNTEKTVMETMIPQIKRDNCLSVAMHPKNGSPYEIRRMAFKDAAGNPTYSFMLYQNDKVYTDLTLDAARLSELLVSSGTAYIRETVAEVPPLPVQEAYADPADYAEARAEYEKSLAVYLKKCADHGLREEDSPAYYRITDLAENTYTVYVGNVSPTGGGYYMRVEGKEAVYVSQTAQMGDFLKGSSADFVSCQLFYPANNTYAYAYPRSFSALETERLTDSGTAVTSADTVRITCTGGTTGDTPVSFTVNLGEAGTEEALRTLLVGKTPGTYREPFVLGEETYTLLSVDYIENSSLRFALQYVQASARTDLHSYSVYAFFGPENITSYTPDSTSTITVLENFLGMSGEVVQIGVTEEALEKYALYRYTVNIQYPLFGETVYKTNENGDSTDDLDPVAYVSAYLMVSPADENGKCYVAAMPFGLYTKEEGGNGFKLTPGVGSYDIIARVDASSLSFLFCDFLELCDPYPVTTPVLNLASLDFDFRYGDEPFLNRHYTLFPQTQVVQESQHQSAAKKIVSLAAYENGDRTGTPITLGKNDISSFTEFYYFLTFLKYRGEHGLSGEALEQAKDEQNLLLTLTLASADDGTYAPKECVYSFYALSPDRVMGSRKDEYGRLSDRFTLFTTDFRAMARAYSALLSGKKVDSNSRYQAAD